MSRIRALVVDDEEHAREGVCALLRAQPGWQVIGECDSAVALRSALELTVPDVVFLDIRLPGGDGIGLARVLQMLVPRPLVVFTTAFETYALDAFEVQAIDYLLKPFDDRRFQAALRRVEQALPSRGGGPAPAPARFLERLVIRSIGRVQFVDVAQVEWLEASGNYVEVHAGGESFLHRERLRVLEAELDPAVFLRIHRSVIVNRGAVAELRPIAGGDHTVVLRGGRELRLSRTYRAALDALEGSDRVARLASRR
ncbi:MAG TPA: LytTR family DNA-binding domain-containing protein [Kofleriaceae bacterium]|nr:LytTR family DNA-binding domain-containing protein [Kofleriaceae bacterium]